MRDEEIEIRRGFEIWRERRDPKRTVRVCLTLCSISCALSLTNLGIRVVDVCHVVIATR